MWDPPEIWWSFRDGDDNDGHHVDGDGDSDGNEDNSDGHDGRDDGDDELTLTDHFLCSRYYSQNITYANPLNL